MARMRREVSSQAFGSYVISMTHAASHIMEVMLLARQAGDDVPADFSALEEAAETLFARPDAAADGTLQIMTIHKAKGLEFPLVFIVGILLAMALFVIAFAVGFSSTMATLVIVTFVIGCVLLAPSIILGYAVKAAERDDRAVAAEPRLDHRVLDALLGAAGGEQEEQQQSRKETTHGCHLEEIGRQAPGSDWL